MEEGEDGERKSAAQSIEIYNIDLLSAMPIANR